MTDYIHIMLVGEHTDHVWTAFNDIRFQKIRRIYLLHSPNQTKDSHLIKCTVHSLNI